MYAAGDTVTGPSSVVEAMATGRGAARSVHERLSGEDVSIGAAFRPDGRDFPVIPSDIPSIARPKMPERQPGSRKDSFDEVCLGLNESQIVAEAERCLQCGICAECFQCVEACQAIGAIEHGAVAAFSIL